jgi:hypothetical protein
MFASVDARRGVTPAALASPRPDSSTVRIFRWRYRPTGLRPNGDGLTALSALNRERPELTCR